MDAQSSAPPTGSGESSAVEAAAEGPSSRPAADSRNEAEGPARRPSESLQRIVAQAAALLTTRRRAARNGGEDAPDDGAESEADATSGAMSLNVSALRSRRVDDVMVPRADIVSVDLSASLEETLEAFREGQHSRLPVYRETLDDPVGVVHLKDLALVHGFGGSAEDFSLANHLRSVLVVPPSMRIQALLQRMQASRRHMALVIDEYGGVDGLVTIEDILEQIVGEIDDEHDDAERPKWFQQADGAYVADARALVSEFQEEIGVQLLMEDWEEEIDTLGGVIFVLCGRVPERGEVVTHDGGLEFEILDADPRRIKRLRIRRVDSQSAASAAASSADSPPPSEPPSPSGGDPDPAKPATDASGSASAPEPEGDRLAAEADPRPSEAMSATALTAAVLGETAGDDARRGGEPQAPRAVAGE